MSPRSRVLVVTMVGAVAVGAAVGVGVVQLQRARTAAAAPTHVSLAARGAFDGVPHVVFRSTAPGDLYGRVSIVALDDPAGPRDTTPVACDRVDAVPGRAACLRTERGVVTIFTANLLDDHWKVIQTWGLPGVPSRTRLSEDGARLATTSFVTGHSYATTGFSTETVIHGIAGAPQQETVTLGNIETYALLVDGKKVAPVDRNMWGVTFIDDETFFATAQSQALGKTWLVKGSITDRALTAVAEQVECPSVSPDGKRVAFKRDTVDGPGIHWTPAVYDVATGDVTLLSGETRSIDDQIEWLDDDTVLYGMPRADQPGVTDVWSVDTDPAAVPSVFVPEAWSPAVVRQP